MKTKLFILAAFIFSLGAQSQVINSTHAFAIGTTEGVTIKWNAFDDETITGCMLYKRITQNSPLQLITLEMLVSTDSLFSFLDKGEFDLISPPFYEIHAVNTSGSIKINECFGFNSIDFEVLDANRIRFGLTPWNQDTCCSYAQVYHNEAFLANLDYNETFQTTIDLSTLSPGDVLKFTLINDAGNYESSLITYSYLNHLSKTLSLGNPKLSDILSQNSPNPFSTETTIRFDLKEKSLVSLNIYSMDGRWIESMINNTLMPGLHSYTFSKGNLKPGTYLYRLTTDKEVGVRKMVVH